ncbi:MAG: bifunctional folylpolyglutamate synthase/dihydrofolate synthase [Clostridia bacterium]|nr:bifunctional folylpolyglutamate synthase/dihydrofolate synthase [Clostridia bacterium]
MTEQQALTYIQGLQKRGIQPGLTRIRAALSALGEPQERLRIVHIAGTNGKGSTAEMIRCIATAAGYQVGLYTSPAVTSLADTISIDGAPIPPDALAALTDELKIVGAELTEFEFTTALAICWFVREQVDLAVIECGLGGREDATNVFSAPLAAVFTPIALDHTQLLGDTLQAIAYQKAGIIQSGCKAVISAAEQASEALSALQKEAAALGLSVRVANTDCKGYSLAMQGAHQQTNAQTAIETIAALNEQGFAISEAAIRQGLAVAVLPCRQERLDREIPLLLDGAHNPQGVAALAHTIRFCWPDTPVILLTGMLADKNVAACAALLAPLADKVICCTPDHPDRALPATELAAYYPHAIVQSDPQIAFEQARRLAKDQNLPLVVAGSFYLAKEIRKML